MDDDSHVLPEWDKHIGAFISNNAPFDVAGHVFYVNHRSEEHLRFLRSRTWYHSEERENSEIWFATGGLFMARTEFLREHDFPDRSMVKRADDVLLGELCQQQDAKLVDFGHIPEIMDRIRISDGNRRGDGEGSDGWKMESVSQLPQSRDRSVGSRRYGLPNGRTKKSRSAI
jgi:hypothetical protein